MADQTIDWDIIQRADAGDTTRLIDLYKIITPEQILAKLENILSNIPNQGRRTQEEWDHEKEKDTRIVQSLTPILTKIKSLCDKTSARPAGSQYPTPIPPQHIYRQQAPRAKEDDPIDILVRSSDDEWKFDAYAAEVLQENKSNLNIRSNYYWALIDLLALFFTKLGPAPPGATASTFFLPLTAVFARWANMLMARVNRIAHSQLVKYRPSSAAGPDAATGPEKTGLTDMSESKMFQCTWIEPEEGSGTRPEFAIGASSGGFHPQLDLRAFGDYLARARWSLLDKTPNISSYTPVQAAQDPDHPTRVIAERVTWGFENNTPANWKFGSCAETYPFMQLLAGREQSEKDRATGFALKTTSVVYKTNQVVTHTYDEDYLLKTQNTDVGVRHRFIEPPCDNCKFLLYFNKANGLKFEPGRVLRLPAVVNT